MDITTLFGTVKIKLLKGETGEQGPQGIQGEPFEFEDFTPAQLAELRADVASVYYRKLEATYHTVGENTTTIEIPFDSYLAGDMLFVDVEGLALTEGTDYTIEDKNIVLVEPITHHWTAVNFRLMRAIAIAAEDYDALKGDAGEVQFSYLKPSYVRSFETVADMQDADDLIGGMVCHTNGFHTSGDGGAAYYTISASGTANGMDVLACAGGLYATLVYDGAKVNIRQLGAKDNADISPIIAYAVSYLMQNYPTSQVSGDRIAGGGIIEIPAGEYNMNSAVSLTNVGCVSFIGDSRGSTIINVATGTRGAFTALASSNTPALWEIVFDNLTFMGNTAFDFTLPHDVFIRNCRFYNIESPQLAIILYLTVNVIIENCSFYNCNIGVYLASAGVGPATTLTVRDCWFAHCKYGVSCSFGSSNYFTDMLLENCIFEYCSVRGIGITGNATNVSDMTMRNCYFEGNANSSISENVSLKAYDNYFDPTEPLFVVRGAAGTSDIVSEKDSFSMSSTNFRYVATSVGYVKDTMQRVLSYANKSTNISTIASAFNGIIEFTSAEGNYIGLVAFVQGTSNTLTKLGGSLTPVSNVAGTVLFDNTTSPMLRVKW